MFLSNVLIGTLEDNVDLLTSKEFYLTSQPVIDVLFFVFKRYFGINSIFLSNLFVIFTFALIFFTCFKLFKLHFSKYISIILSLIFILSPYHLYHLRGHISLIQTWTIVLYLYLFLKSKNVRDFILLGVYLGFVSLISNYLAFFCLLFIVLFIVARIITDYVLNKSFKTKEIRNYCIHIIISMVSITIFLWPYAKVNYFNPNSSTKENLSIYDVERPKKVRYERPIEDFIIFSARPWYYFLPSVDNPFFGDISKNVITALQDKWGYYLTFNYFKSEHSSNYLGLVNLILAVPGFIFITKKVFTKDRKNNKDNKNTKFIQLFILSLTGLGFIILSMPPYFVLFGLKIFTPSYLLWKVFPMFRVLSRLSIFVLLIELILAGFGISNFIEKYPKCKKGILITVLVLSFMEFYIPLKFTDLSSIPQPYVYVKNNTLVNANIFIYPHSKLLESKYWKSEHNRNLVNVNKDVSYTESLLTCNGLNTIRDSTDYLIYFKNADNNYTNNILFLENNPILEKIVSFEYTDKDELDLGIFSKFVRIIKAGDTLSNSATVYKINKNATLNCSYK